MSRHELKNWECIGRCGTSGENECRLVKRGYRTTRTRSSSPLRSRRPICFWPIRWGFEPAADRSSRSREGNPYDHASCETFLKTLKREEIDATSYRDLEHWRANIEEFIERYSNRCRLHSALGYRTPEEIESSVQTETLSLGTTMSFFSGMRRSIDPMFRRSRRKPTSTHRFDESSVGYSLAGWSPPEPASALPTVNHSPETEAL